MKKALIRLGEVFTSIARRLPILLEALGEGAREWSLVIDGTVRNENDMTLLIALTVWRHNEQWNAIPLKAYFICSKNEEEVRDYLQTLKAELQISPYSVVSDYSDAFLKVVPELFPVVAYQGCHEHARRILERKMIAPVLRRLRAISRSWSTRSLSGVNDTVQSNMVTV